ncbi:insulinase family protein [Leptolyngbya sp. 15MV]|nr:insulinase family protein [Leptolyngbya sp. 15MV]
MASTHALLAEGWQVSQDGLRYVFTLRAGVRSPYGNELTAADVEWSWAKSFAQRRTGAFIANVSNVTAVKALSAREVEFTLSAPSSILLAALTLYVPGIYDSTEVKKHATAEDPWGLRWMESNTAGFGAYHLRSVRAGEQAEFVANPHYFRGRPHFDRIVYRAVPSGASRTTLLRSGQVQWIDRPTVQQVLDMQRDRRVKVQDQAGRAMASVRMNCTMRPFDDVRVRRAMNFAVNKDAIRQGVGLGTGEIARSIVPPIVRDYDPSFFAYDHDPARARALLAEAGFPNGFEVDLLFSNIWWWEEPMAVQMADQLRAVGITCRPQRITGSDLRARGAPARQDMALFTFEDGRPATSTLTSTAIRDIMTGKKVTVRGGPSGPDTVTLTVTGSPADLEIGMQLAHLLLTDPVIEGPAFQQFRQGLRLAIGQRSRDIQAFALGEVLPRLIYPPSEARMMPLMPEQVDALTLESAQEWLRTRIITAPMEVSVVGEIDQAVANNLIRRYVSSLPARPRVSNTLMSELRTIARPTGPLDARQEFATATDKAMVGGGFFGPDPSNVRESRLFQVASRILSTRAIQEIREKRQLAYSPGVGFSPSAAFPGYSSMILASSTEPSKVESFRGAIFELFDAFAASGPSEEEMATVRKQFANTWDEQMREPAYWSRVLSTLNQRWLTLDDVMAGPGQFQTFTADSRRGRGSSPRWSGAAPGSRGWRT